MADVVPTLGRVPAAQPSFWSLFTRPRTFLPQEHGGWVLFLLPLAIGAIAGGTPRDRILPALAFSLAALALFLARQPLDLGLKSLLGKRPRHDLPAVAAWLVIDGSVALLAGSYALWTTRLWGLLAIGICALFFMALQLWALQTRLYRTAAVEVITTAGLGLGAAGLYYLARGVWSSAALALWILVALQEVGGVLYSRWRLRRRRLAAQGKPYNLMARTTVLVHFTLAVGVALALAIPGWAPWVAVPLFVVLLARAAWGMRRSAPADRTAMVIGVGEGVATLVGAAWLALSFLLR